MALKDAEIAELKAGVPARFQPAGHMRGLLPAMFGEMAELRSATPRGGPPHEYGNAFTDELARHNAGLAFLGSADGDAAPGFMLTGAQAAIQSQGEHSEQKKREREAFDQIKAELDRRLAALDAELAEIDSRLDAIRLRRGTIADRLDAIDDLNTLLASGKLDQNNPVHAALLRRAGYVPDDAKSENFADRVKNDRRDLSREDDALESEWNTKMKRRGQVVSERAKVQAARDEIENAHTPEAMEAAERRARTVLGSQQIGEAAYQTESQSAKHVAADAVAHAERDEVRADSEAYSRSAVLKDETTVITTDDSGPKF